MIGNIVEGVFILLFILLIAGLLLSGIAACVLVLRQGRRITRLERGLTELRDAVTGSPGGVPETGGDAASRREPGGPEAAESGAASAAVTNAATASPAAAPERPRSPRLDAVIYAFSRYWTGVLGSLALVVGFSFLVVLTALEMGPFPRFLLLIAVAAVLLGVQRFLRGGRNSAEAAAWRRHLAAWLRSAAGALVLFAAVAASTLEGMRWIDSPLQGYVLLIGAIVLNLYLAVHTRFAVQLGFHSLISLAALAIAPPSWLSLAAAVGVSAISSVPAARRGWSMQLLLGEVVFFAFITAWKYGGMMGSMLAESAVVPAAAVSAAAVIALLVGLLPVLIISWLPGTRLEGRTPLPARIGAWLLAAVGIMLFSDGAVYAAPLLLAFGGAAWAAPHLPRAPHAPAWLRRIDTTAGLLLGMLAAYSLVRLQLDWLLILAIAYGICVLFSFDRTAGRFPQYVGEIVQGIIAAAAVALSLGADLLVGAPLGSPAPSSLQAILLYGLFFAGGLVELLWSSRKRKRRITAALLPLILLALYVTPAPTAETSMLFLSGLPVLLAAGAAVLVFQLRPTVRRHLDWWPITWGILLAALYLAAPLIYGSDSTFANGLYTLPERLLHGSGLLGFAAAALWFSRLYHGAFRIWNWWLASSAGALCVILAALPLDPPASVLLLSGYGLVLQGIVSIVRSDTDGARVPVTNSARGIASNAITASGAWISALTVVYAMDSMVWSGVLGLGGDVSGAAASSSVGILSAHAGAVFVLAAWTRLLSSQGGTAALRFALIAGIAVVSREIDPGYRELTLAAAAVLVYAASTAIAGRIRERAWLRSLIGHSYWLYAAGLGWFALGRLADAQPQPNLVLTAAAVFCLSLYPVLIVLLKGYDGTTPWRRHADRLRGRWQLLPLFVALGIGLGFQLDGPTLTAILLVESLLIFAAGILTRDRLFRPAAYTLLVLSLGRILLIDLARSDTLSRAIIFILAGVCLLGMNWLYNRWTPPRE